MNRRQFLTTLASAAAAAVVSRRAFAQMGVPQAAAPIHGELTIDTKSLGPKIPPNYTGLSYELAELTDPDFFSPSNKQLVALFRLLTPTGVLRLGGNSSESCWFRASPATTAPTLRVPPGPLSENWMPHELFEISPKAVDNVAAFLDATGWQLVYGLNLGNSTPERAAAEAEYVFKAVGSHLLYFQIGNEPDFYNQSNNRTRPPNWGFADYLVEWSRYADAISARVPSARFGGPDVGASSDWIAPFTARAVKTVGPRLVTVSGHYYAEGPPDDPSVTIARLLRTDPAIFQRTKAICDAAAAQHLLYRMTEGNSCYRGGKPGMSDALASALWAGDYMLTLASAGCSGVNFHGGTRNMLRAALGNHMPGARLAKDPTPARGAFYTPIAGQTTTGCAPRPIYYGMFLANQLAGAQIVTTNFTTAGVNATAYAAQRDGRLKIALFNKTDSKDLRIAIKIAHYSHSKVLRLTAPALDATTAPTLGGSQITPDGQWSPTKVEALTSQSQGYTVDLPRASAALILLN